MANGLRTSEDVLAQVMTPIALRPGVYSQVGIAKQTNLSEGSVSRATSTLVARDWAKDIAVKRDSPGRPQKLYTTTAHFDAVVNQTLQFIDKHVSPRERRLFTDAVDMRAATQVQWEQKDFDADLAGYLGRAVLLGERQSLAETDWFDGAVGWRTLIEITANRLP